LYDRDENTRSKGGRSMQPFTRRAVAVIRSIPAGKVMTYAQIAEAAGSRRGARQVVRILHSLSESQRLPWHRVVDAQGRLVIADEEARFTQRIRLLEEGVEVGADDRIDLATYRHFPDVPLPEDAPPEDALPDELDDDEI